MLVCVCACMCKHVCKSVVQLSGIPRVKSLRCCSAHAKAPRDAAHHFDQPRARSPGIQWTEYIMWSSLLACQATHSEAQNFLHCGSQVVIWLLSAK
jgi:hypothetical protein